MADLERQFRDALGAPDVETASEPAMMGGDAEGAEGGDMSCPMCGASAMKIVQAAQGGGKPGGMGGGGMMGGMK